MGKRTLATAFSSSGCPSVVMTLLDPGASDDFVKDIPACPLSTEVAAMTLLALAGSIEPLDSSRPGPDVTHQGSFKAVSSICQQDNGTTVSSISDEDDLASTVTSSSGSTCTTSGSSHASFPLKVEFSSMNLGSSSKKHRRDSKNDRMAVLVKRMAPQQQCGTLLRPLGSSEPQLAALLPPLQASEKRLAVCAMPPPPPLRLLRAVARPAPLPLPSLHSARLRPIDLRLA
jgi:hypothetical protein